MSRWVCSLLLLAGGLLTAQHWLVINTSPSFPRGLYLRTHQTPRIGDLVLACPPDTSVFREALQRRFLFPGFCPAGTGQLIKQLVAMQGDDVTVEDAGVSVNGVRLPNSARQDLQISAIDPFRRVLADEVLLMSPHPDSFDGRYFGPLNERCLITTLRPLWVKE